MLLMRTSDLFSRRVMLSKEESFVAVVRNKVFMLIDDFLKIEIFTLSHRYFHLVTSNVIACKMLSKL